MLFFVTGCSTGLGLSLANAIVDAGHTCIASSRDPSKTPDIVAAFKERGGHWVTLDVAGPNLEQIMAEVISQYGPIDVLINNAGRVMVGPMDSEPLDEARKLFETNYWGVIRAVQAVVPSMRERRSGTVVNISSSNFWGAWPLQGTYSGSKGALEMMSESLSAEVAVLGIRTLLVEPGSIRSNFANTEGLDLERLAKRMEFYKSSPVEHVYDALSTLHGKQAIDPDKCAKAIVDNILKSDAASGVERLALGADSLAALKARAEALNQVARASEAVASTVEY